MNRDNKPNIVIIDDEVYICSIISEALANENYQVVTFSEPSDGLKYIEENQVDLVLTDLVMGDYNGVQVIETAINNHSDATVILMTAHPTVETAIEVLKKGAYDFLVKPFKLDVLKATIKRGLEHQQIKKDNVRLKEQVAFLQVAQAGVFEEDTTSFMKLVVNSCKKELGATGVAMVQVNPDNSKVINQIVDCDNDDFLDELYTESMVYDFAYNKSSQPKITREKIEYRGNINIKTNIIQPIIVRRKLYGLISVIVIDKFDAITSGQMSILSLLSSSAATTLANFKLYEDLEKSYMHAITALAKAIEARDAYTAGHTERVSRLAEIVANELNWSEKKIRNVRMGCILHDIGKIGVPDSILNKNGALTDDEKLLMNSHPELGLTIIKGIDLFKPAIPYIESHHEWFNGSGYPKGLKGDEIPEEGRLLSVVDTFDAIMSNRPYRKGNNLRNTVEEILKNINVQFDPSIVYALLSVINKGLIDFKDLYDRHEDISTIQDIELVTVSESV